MKTFLLHMLGTLWCLCWVIPFWLLYILPLLLLGEIKFMGWDSPFIAAFKVNKTRSWYTKAWKDWGGCGLPCAYIVKHIFCENIIRHERRHVYQWFVLGPLFPLVYIAGILIGLLRGDSYYLNPLEVDAYKAERKVDV